MADESNPFHHPTMTVDEVAAALRLARSTAYQAVRTGEIPSIRIGRRLLVPTAAVRQMLEGTAAHIEAHDK